MTLFSFSGGVHPNDNKQITKDKIIEDLKLYRDDIVSIPFSQHLGAPSSAIVKKKDKVQTGQLIGSAEGMISANVHSSVTGVVEGITYAPNPILGRILSVNIKITDEDTDCIKINSSDSFIDMVKNAGIVGLGGATFPSHVKLSPPMKIDTFIVNGVECEPYLTCDYRLMVEKTEDILKGMDLIRKELKINNVIVAIEKNKPEAINIFKKYEKEYDFKVVPLKVVYPQGGEKQLIKSAIKKIVPEGKLPLEIGVIVHNVGTVLSIYDAFYNQKPLIERVVTVTGSVKEPKNLNVKIGTPVFKLIEACGGFVGKPRKIIMGGPMMGLTITSTNTPVTKSTSGILVFREENLPNMTSLNCIRCGKCVRTCPMGLVPPIMEQFSINEMYEKLTDWHVLNCIECGCCSYVCPSRRPLVAYFKTAKREVLTIVKQRAKNV